MEEEKDKGGRPSKLTHELIDIFSEIVEENILAWTNEDLFDELCDRLKKEGKEGISYTTFKNWKNNADHLELHQEFLSVIKKALRNQKKTIVNELKNDPENRTWQRLAWICERKFSEWNLKQINETKTDLTVSQFPEFIIKKKDGEDK